MKKFAFYLVTLMLISCSSKKIKEQETISEMTDQVSEKTRIQTTPKKEKPAPVSKKKDIETLKVEQFFPYADCIKSTPSVPLDTIYSYEATYRRDSSTLGYVYQIEEDSMNFLCLQYYKKFQIPEKGKNYSLGDIYYEYDSVLDATIYESNEGYDTLFNHRCDCEDAVNYQIDAYFDFINSYLIIEGAWESYSIYLVNRLNGEKTRIDALPQFNPSKNMFVASHFNEFGDASSFAIYSIHNGEIKIYSSFVYRYEDEFSQFLKVPDKHIWISDSIFIYKNWPGYDKNVYAFKIVDSLY